MRLDAATSSSLRSVLAGPAQPAAWLGVTPAALYLRVPAMPGVVAVLAHGAVRLPCAVLLPTTSEELPLTAIGAQAGDALLGDGCLAWTGPLGPVIVRTVREWAPAQVSPGQVRAEALSELLEALPPSAGLGIDSALLTQLESDPAAAVAGLLGRGPGLTPAGDDVLAGFLLGARALRLDVAGARAAALAMAPDRTTALSAALLWHAARGECVDEVAAVVAGPSGPALCALLRVGHSSGAALATGLATAVSAALRARKASAAA